MKSKTILGTIGAAVSVAVLGIIGWGRVRSVDVPHPRTWDHRPALALDDSTGKVDRALLNEARGQWREHGHDAACCTSATPDVVISVDPTLDTDPGTCGPGDVDETTCPAQVWGVTHCTSTAAGVTLRCTVRMHPRAGALAYGHELGHVFGFEHPDNPPSGVIMHAHRPGWDFRGIGEE